MNVMSSDRRRYELKARAERQQQTRERIVAATEDLHREVGPARTTVADIARRAGVQRLTVYNNFPALGDLLAACQGRFLAGHPPPDLAPRQGLDPLAGLERALRELYAWFRANEALESNIHRDRQLLPELDDLLRRGPDQKFDAAAAAHAELLGGGEARRRLIRLALQFSTWQLLAGEGASDAEIASLLSRAVDCAP